MDTRTPDTETPSVKPSLFWHLKHSVLVKLGLVLSFLAMLSFISIVISTVIADSSSGKASAINVSGSLRMMSFRLLSEIQQPDKHPAIPATLEQFERRLKTLELLVSQQPDPSLNARLSFIHQHWYEHIRPLALQGIGQETSSQGAILTLSRDIPVFVGRIDEVVFQIENDLEERIRFLRAAQFIMLAIALVVSFITAWMLRRQLVSPLAELLKAARSVAAGSFSARVNHTTRDELGELGQAFNTMMEEIGRMYSHLEDMVADKTQELTRTNESLELLYQTSQRLADGDLNLNTIEEVLHEVEDKLQLGHSMICISEHQQTPAQRLSASLTPEEIESLCANDCHRCFELAQQPIDAPPIKLTEPMRVKFISLENHENRQAVLPLLARDSEIPREKLKIMETVGRHIATALDNMRRTEERHRLAVLEERTVIARELHDSIAQSLSYLNIQVMRLDKQLNVESTPEAKAIAAELKHGLKAAYRELREVITTFRLRVDERGFNAALQETIEEFGRKCGFSITANNSLAGIVLNGNEEMHVIRIIREALANIEKHAKATEAQISIDMDETQRVHVRIRDNGKGFDPNAPARNHYGLIIMRDRAMILDGEVNVQSSTGAGTSVTLTFCPQQFQAAENLSG